MATKRIDELTAATELTGDDLLPIMDGAATTKKITAANARTYMAAASDPTGTASTAVSNHVAALDPHTQYALESALGSAATTASSAYATAAQGATADAALAKASNLSDLTNAGTARTNLGLGTAATTASTAYATSAQGATADAAVPKALFDANTVLYATTDNTPVALTVGASTIVGRKASGDIVALTGAEAAVIVGLPNQAEFATIAIGDETTAITTGLAKVTWRAPMAMTLTAVRASLTTASSSGVPTVDINEGGTTILSTKLTIDANELTSTTAATAVVISDAAIADDAELTFDIDVAGTGAKGLKVTLYWTRA